MRIKLFCAPTLAQAMNQIRAELGSDALILSTASRAGQIEVTAALEPEDEPDLDLVPADWPVRDEAPARPVPADLAWHNLPVALAAALQAAPDIETGCRRHFRYAGLPLNGDGPPLLLAGPPGAGKTLTIAKLAARLVMAGHQPLVVTADDRRAGAVEQLASFTRLLGLTLIAAGRPQSLQKAMTRRDAASPVLIDAPGLDLSDGSEREILADLIAAVDGRCALVLPAGLDPLEATEVADRHAEVGADLLVMTRLDRQRRLGGLLAAAATGLALTEAGTGADVASGLVAVNPAFVAARLVAPATGGSQTAVPASAPDPQPARPSVTMATLERHMAAQKQTSPLLSRKTTP